MPIEGSLARYQDVCVTTYFFGEDKKVKTLSFKQAVREVSQALIRESVLMTVTDANRTAHFSFTFERCHYEYSTKDPNAFIKELTQKLNSIGENYFNSLKIEHLDQKHSPLRLNRPFDVSSYPEEHELSILKRDQVLLGR